MNAEERRHVMMCITYARGGRAASGAEMPLRRGERMKTRIITVWRRSEPAKRGEMSKSTGMNSARHP